MRSARSVIAVVQLAFAVALAVGGYWSSGLAFGILAALMWLASRLHDADKTTWRYLTRVSWAFAAIGVGFLVLATLQVTGRVGYGTVLAIPLDYAAGVGFLYLSWEAAERRWSAPPDSAD